jgi:hypothetical protein
MGMNASSGVVSLRMIVRYFAYRVQGRYYVMAKVRRQTDQIRRS